MNNNNNNLKIAKYKIIMSALSTQPLCLHDCRFSCFSVLHEQGMMGHVAAACDTWRHAPQPPLQRLQSGDVVGERPVGVVALQVGAGECSVVCGPVEPGKKRKKRKKKKQDVRNILHDIAANHTRQSQLFLWPVVWGGDAQSGWFTPTPASVAGASTSSLPVHLHTSRVKIRRVSRVGPWNGASFMLSINPSISLFKVQNDCETWSKYRKISNRMKITLSARKHKQLRIKNKNTKRAMRRRTRPDRKSSFFDM